MSATPANITISKGPAKVTVDTVAVEQTFIKMLKSFNVPKTKVNQSITDGPNDTKVVDLLLKTEERFTIRGHISTDTAGTDGDTSATGAAITDANDKRDALRAMFFAGMEDSSLVTMVYEGDSYEVAIEKISINWSADDQSPVVRYDVTLTCLVGVAL